LELIKWDGESNVEMLVDGWTFCGAKRKDFFSPDEKWEEILIPGIMLRVWTIQFSRVMGFEYDDSGEWVSIWCCGNDFKTKFERVRSAKAYNDFAESEAKKITNWIDEGKNLAEINSLIDKGHTGFTFGWALNYGITHSKNKENAEKVRLEHNGEYGVTGNGVVNPAILTIKQ